MCIRLGVVWHCPAPRSVVWAGAVYHGLEATK